MNYTLIKRSATIHSKHKLHGDKDLLCTETGRDLWPWTHYILGHFLCCMRQHVPAPSPSPALLHRGRGCHSPTLSRGWWLCLRKEEGSHSFLNLTPCQSNLLPTLSQAPSAEEWVLETLSKVGGEMEAAGVWDSMLGFWKCSGARMNS